MIVVPFVVDSVNEEFLVGGDSYARACIHRCMCINHVYISWHTHEQKTAARINTGLHYIQNKIRKGLTP